MALLTVISVLLTNSKEPPPPMPVKLAPLTAGKVAGNIVSGIVPDVR